MRARTLQEMVEMEQTNGEYLIDVSLECLGLVVKKRFHNGVQGQIVQTEPSE